MKALEDEIEKSKKDFKNATAFFTNAFKRKAALNKGSLFYISALVKIGMETRNLMILIPITILVLVVVSKVT